jgi:hypothetical protein
LSRPLLLPSRLPGPLNAADEFRGRHTQGIADSEQEIDGRRLPVVFKLADVGAVNVGSERQLFLRLFRVLTGFSEFIAEHPRKVSGECWAVC